MMWFIHLLRKASHSSSGTRRGKIIWKIGWVQAVMKSSNLSLLIRSILLVSEMASKLITNKVFSSTTHKKKNSKIRKRSRDSLDTKYFSSWLKKQRKELKKYKKIIGWQSKIKKKLFRRRSRTSETYNKKLKWTRVIKPRIRVSVQEQEKSILTRK